MQFDKNFTEKQKRALCLQYSFYVPTIEDGVVPTL